MGQIFSHLLEATWKVINLVIVHPASEESSANYRDFFNVTRVEEVEKRTRDEEKQRPEIQQINILGAIRNEGREVALSSEERSRGFRDLIKDKRVEEVEKRTRGEEKQKPEIQQINVLGASRNGGHEVALSSEERSGGVRDLIKDKRVEEVEKRTRGEEKGKPEIQQIDYWNYVGGASRNGGHEVALSSEGWSGGVRDLIKDKRVEEVEKRTRGEEKEKPEIQQIDYWSYVGGASRNGGHEVALSSEGWSVGFRDSIKDQRVEEVEKRTRGEEKEKPEIQQINYWNYVTHVGGVSRNEGHDVALSSEGWSGGVRALIKDKSVEEVEKRTRSEEKQKREREECNHSTCIAHVIIDVDIEEKWIMHYSSSHRILLVGEGDFSFSACLARAFGSAHNMTATSLDSIGFLLQNYRNAKSNIKLLQAKGCRVLHELDATKMVNCYLLKGMKFDRIVFNFPYAGLDKDGSRKTQIKRHQNLVQPFFMNAALMISRDGEVHVTHKSNPFHLEWGLERMAAVAGLYLKEEEEFWLSDYPGYSNKYGFGGDGNFYCRPSKTYKFRLRN